jgi:hypothetical protein
MIETANLNQLLLEAFSGKCTWLEASTKYSLEEYIEAFQRTRAAMKKTIADLTDAQVSFSIQQNPIWSISEMVTHLIYSQNFYYNQLLDITTSELPHIVEAAKGFGEGAKVGRPAIELRADLDKATVLIEEVIEKTHKNNDPNKITDTGRNFFGKVNYQTWILLLLGHETDHVRQGILMRRAARAAFPAERPT